jgi:hypothetical protein
MSMEHLVEWQLEGETEAVGGNLLQFHFSTTHLTRIYLGSNSDRHPGKSATNCSLPFHHIKDIRCRVLLHSEFLPRNVTVHIVHRQRGSSHPSCKDMVRVDFHFLHGEMWPPNLYFEPTLEVEICVPELVCIRRDQNTVSIFQTL